MPQPHQVLPTLSPFSLSADRCGCENETESSSQVLRLILRISRSHAITYGSDLGYSSWQEAVEVHLAIFCGLPVNHNFRRGFLAVWWVLWQEMARNKIYSTNWPSESFKLGKKRMGKWTAELLLPPLRNSGGFDFSCLAWRVWWTFMAQIIADHLQCYKLPATRYMKNNSPRRGGMQNTRICPAKMVPSKIA